MCTMLGRNMKLASSLLSGISSIQRSRCELLLLRSTGSSRTLMRAVRIHRFGGPEVLQVDSVEEPVENDNEVLIKVESSGINPVDTYTREGWFANRPPLPLILGKEAAGAVIRIGKNVTKFQVGDRVYCCLPWNGGYAENVVCAENHTFHLSNKLSFSQGAGIYVPYFTAYRALLIKCLMKAGEFLLVHGASGAVGVAAVQLAKHFGLTVVGTAGTEAGLEVARKAGADYVFNHRDSQYLKAAHAVTDGKGFDVLLENMAHVNLGHDLTVLAQKARLAVVGSRSEVTLMPRHLMFTESTIVGIKLLANTVEEMQEMGHFLLKGANDGWVCPIIDHEFDLDDAVSAHEHISSGKGRKGKLVFRV